MKIELAPQPPKGEQNNYMFDSEQKTNNFHNSSPLGRLGGAGIYIHIPFCKQACHYCDFHFSTSMKKKDEMVLALAKEIKLRKSEFQNESVVTIYFGGGTPSRLSIADLRFLIATIYEQYTIVEKPEIIELSTQWSEAQINFFKKMLQQGGELRINGAFMKITVQDKIVDSSGNKDQGIIVAPGLDQRF